MRRETKATKAIRVDRDRLAHRGRRDLPAHREHREIKATKATKASRDGRDPQVRRG